EGTSSDAYFKHQARAGASALKAWGGPASSSRTAHEDNVRRRGSAAQVHHPREEAQELLDLVGPGEVVAAPGDLLDPAQAGVGGSRLAAKGQRGRGDDRIEPQGRVGVLEP